MRSVRGQAARWLVAAANRRPLAAALGRVKAVRLPQRRTAEPLPPRSPNLRIRLPDGLVLPQPFRRTARRLSKIELPRIRHAGLKGAAVILLATGTYGAVAGDHVDAIVGALTAKAGLTIEAVKISGQSETDELAVLDRLAIPGHASLLTFDAEAARQRVEGLPWVEAATIRKIYPDTLRVEIKERTPFAIWQRGQMVSLIDGDGKVITDTIEPQYANLPMVVGIGAQLRVHEMVALLDEAPELKVRVRAATLVSERRWNLTLNDGIEIMLPEHGAQAALARLDRVERSSGLLGRQIDRVDLRLADRLVVRLTDGGMTKLNAVLKEREKELRRRGANA